MALASDPFPFAMTVPADEHGWQVTYHLTLQAGVRVVTSLVIESTRPPEAIPPGGLTTDRARSIIRIGEVLALWLQNAARWDPLASTSAIEHARWKRLPRGQRLAQTAALYVRALRQGHLAPRARVAAIQRRDESAVRDDLHAARCARPPLLTGAGLRGRAGGELTEAAAALLKQIDRPKTRAAAKPRRKGGKR
ncbi:MAG: hypothetical protein M3P16_09795 [Chloroflexota bacterium]|nr:hypothetical protein [Chloroflexota bacterium]